MKTQRGFTLIELVLVIVILGILAAVALPRFADLSTDAESASLAGARGAIASASAIAHAAFLINPATTAIEGTTVDYVNGYPDVVTIANLAGMSVGAGLDYQSTASGATPDVLTITKGPTCRFTYTEALANAAPVISNVHILGGGAC